MPLFFSCSPRVIEYGKYFVTVRELANSMKKGGFVVSHVMEVGTKSIMMNLPPDSKRLVMPLMFSVRKLEGVNIVVLQKKILFFHNRSWSCSYSFFTRFRCKTWN